MDKPLKEHEEIFLWIERNITFSDSLPKLNGCEVLVEFFRTRKFKEQPDKKKLQQLCKILTKSIEKKKANLHLRNHRENKK